MLFLPRGLPTYLQWSSFGLVAVLTLATLFFLLRTATTDPGILHRQDPRAMQGCVAGTFRRIASTHILNIFPEFLEVKR